MTGNSIIQQVSYDVRQTIATTGTAQTILMQYVDRVQRDILHTTFWATLIRSITPITTIVGQPNYMISASPAVRRVLMVYDRSRDRLLLPFELIVSPSAEMNDPGSPQTGIPETNAQAGIPLELKRLKTQSSIPEYYRFASGVMYLFPTPQQVLTIELHYTSQVPLVSDPTATLTLPDDATETMVAGVNMYANLFLSRMQDAQFWAQLYQQLKKGEDLK